jgi:glutamine phosphoribosylpyrophosphate amidotransferase
VIYQDLEGLRASIRQSGGGPEKPCMACLDGEYPTLIEGAGKDFAATRKADRGSCA